LVTRSPLQWSTTSDPLSEVMAGTRRRATTSRSSTEQDSRLMIQILHDRTVPILKPTNPEENNTILNDMVGARVTSVLNTTVLPPPPPRTEDVAPPPASPLVPPPPETNEILTNLVNLLQQQNNSHKRMQKKREKIQTEVATQIEEAQQNKRHTTPVVAYDAASIPANC